jgi:predicted MFS family arabinose efflux permease
MQEQSTIMTQAVPARSRRGELWRQGNFRRFWLGQAISELGSGLGALSLTAILLLDASPAQIGVLAALSGLPVLLVGLQAGVWVDRVRRRPVLIAADLLNALLMLSVPVAWFLGVLRLEQLYVVTFLTGVLTLLFRVAHQSLMPSVVTREHIVEANSRLGLSSNVAEIAAPGAGGLLVQIVTAPFAVLLDACSFLVSALLIWRIDVQEPAPEPSHQRQRMWHDVREGLTVLVHQPVLRTLIGSLAVSRLFGSFYGAVYSIYLIRTLGLSPALMGLTIGAGGAGALLGSLFAEPFMRRWGVGRVLVATSVVGCVVSPLVPLAGGAPWVAFTIIVIAQLVGDFAGSIYDIGELSLRQSLTPDRLLGRTNASAHFVVGGLSTVGMLVGGILAEVIGIRPTVWLTTLGGLFAMIWLISSPVARMRDYPTANEGA